MRGKLHPESIVGTTLHGSQPYRLQQLLAIGGLAYVYLAARADGERVAVKLLRPELEGKYEVSARFEREAMAASRVRHANVLCVFEPVQRADGFSFFAAEHLVGVDLADVLGSQRKLNAGRAVRVAIGAAAGLGAAHAAGVVHRDVKPENLFMVHLPDGREVVKVLDFGSASMAGEPHVTPNLRITNTTSFVGTPGYVAPEQAEGAVGHPTADVYGLGVVLFEAVFGRPPFVGHSWMELRVPPCPRAARRSDRYLCRAGRCPADLSRQAQQGALPGHGRLAPGAGDRAGAGKGITSGLKWSSRGALRPRPTSATPHRYSMIPAGARWSRCRALLLSVAHLSESAPGQPRPPARIR